MKKKLCFKTLDGYLFISPDHINFVKSEDVYAYIYNDKVKLFVNCSLKGLEEKLPSNRFIRCHRSYLINIDKVVKFIRAKNFKLLMENGIEIPLARSKKKIVAERLGIENKA